MSEGYFEAVLEFDEKSLAFGADCVGIDLPFTYKGLHFIICFPDFSFDIRDTFDHPLPVFGRSRHVRKEWLAGQSTDRSFGKDFHRNEKQNRVLKFTCTNLIIRSSKPMTLEQVELAMLELPLWKNVFTEWWEAKNYEDLTDSHIRISQEKNLNCYFVPIGESDEFTVPNLDKGHPASITIISRNSLTQLELKHLLQLSADGLYPPSHYNYLLSSLRHFNQKRHRESLLDTATAIEMALTQLLDQRLSSVPLGQKRLIFNKYRQIRGLTDALLGLGEAIPVDIGNKIGTPRNQALHKGTVITEVKAQEALEVAKHFIYTRLPLQSS